MRAVIFSDLHGHLWSEFGQPQRWAGQLLNGRLVDALRVLKAIRQYCEVEGISLVFFLGDLFHRKRLIDVITFNAIADGMRRLASVVDALYILPGNHDLVTRSAGVFSEQHALRALDVYPRIHVIDEPTVIDTGVASMGMVPYSSERDTTLYGVESVLEGGADALLLHVGIDGATTGAVEFRPREPLELGDLPSDTPTYSGHYHTPQKVGHVVYVGSPMELVRGEPHMDHRGFLEVYLDRPADYDRVPIETPRFKTLGSKSGAAAARGHFVDLVLKTEKDAERVEELTKRFAKARFVNVVYDLKPRSKKARLKVKLQHGRLPSVGDLCDAWADSAEKLDVHEVVKLKHIARQALQQAEEEAGR